MNCLQTRVDPPAIMSYQRLLLPFICSPSHLHHVLYVGACVVDDAKDPVDDDKTCHQQWHPPVGHPNGLVQLSHIDSSFLPGQIKVNLTMWIFSLTPYRSSWEPLSALTRQQRIVFRRCIFLSPLSPWNEFDTLVESADWLNPSKRGGMDGVFRGLALLLRENSWGQSPREILRSSPASSRITLSFPTLLFGCTLYLK